MADTQWPRYEVFLQEKQGDPFVDVGSVHAPDAEMALLNARDVFVRRPACHALWIVPVEAITARTAQELQEQPLPDELPAPPSGELQAYHVFIKTRQAGPQTFTGFIEAASPEEALMLAATILSPTPPPLGWWVFPSEAVLQNDPEDEAAFFEPAQDKPFRLSTGFHTVSAMRKIKSNPPTPPGEDPT